MLLAGCQAPAPRFHAVHEDRSVRVEEVPAPAPGVAAAPEPAPGVAAAPEPAPAVAAPPSLEGWNESQIHWESYEAGLARARTESRPVVLVVSATWCSHCRTYSHVFEDARIVDRARRFVMVHIDQDREGEVAARYALDGQYVPRTYLLAPDGSPMPVTASHPRFHYFYDEADPSSLLAGMDAALAQSDG